MLTERRRTVLEQVERQWAEYTRQVLDETKPRVATLFAGMSEAIAEVERELENQEGTRLAQTRDGLRATLRQSAVEPVLVGTLVEAFRRWTGRSPANRVPSRQ